MAGTARKATAAVAALLLAGCASYRPLPLPDQDNLSDQLPKVINGQRLDLPPLRKHILNPSRGLDDVGVAILAVVNNPGLKAQRKNLDVAAAQVFSAHLLPDPQLSLSLGHPTDGGSGGTNAQSAGLDYGLMSLISHNARLAAARQHQHQTRLDLLWHEWQVAQKARQLYFQLTASQQKVALLKQNVESQKTRYDRAQDQLRLGNVTLATLSADVTGYADVQGRLYQARLDLTDQRHLLNTLLGLKPAFVLKLKAPSQETPNLPASRDDPAGELVWRRPDLLALKAGYQSQEAKVREAILRQFPAINLGVNEANDTSNVHTLGLGLQLNLPLWNANRGDIETQRATRAALRETYQARIDQTLGEVATLRSRFQLLQARYQQLEKTLPTLRQVYRRALASYQAGNFNGLSYLNIQDTLLKQEVEAIDLRTALWQTRISLATLLGWPVGSGTHTTKN